MSLKMHDKNDNSLRDLAVTFSMPDCPRCGSLAHLLENGSTHQVACRSCGLSTIRWLAPEQAVKAWAKKTATSRGKARYWRGQYYDLPEGEDKDHALSMWRYHQRRA